MSAVKKNIKKNKKPWPTKDAMTQVYDLNLWGGGKVSFYSGEGSHDSKLVRPYIEALVSFLNSFETSLTVCDLGCGDFNVGRQLVSYTQKYTGIDIVEGLINRNIELFRKDNLEFKCLDIAVDNLPSADCVILRQVLQHLSNKEVLSVLPKLKKFKYLILTEHLPLGRFTANKDILSGQGIRLKKQSGIDLLKPPFNVVVESQRQLLSIQLEGNKGVVTTTMYTMF